MTMKKSKNFLTPILTQKVRAAYDSLNPLAYKADLARYCILYKNGGWYLDVGLTAIGRADTRVDLYAFPQYEPLFRYELGL